MISLDEVKKDLIRVGDIIGKTPTLRDYDKLGKFGHNIFYRKFGSWNNLLKEIFGKINLEMVGTGETTCNQCGKDIVRNIAEINKSKNHFCSRSCSATYNNTHKKTGNRRSKLEVWLEEELGHLFPNLNILYNEKKAINSELDILIPEFNLAFELNGIFHYEPIFGESKLSKIKNNDLRKMQACLENNIELCIIDASSLKYFKPENAQKYLDIVVKIIEKKIKLR
jgi:hypothetical protein